MLCSLLTLFLGLSGPAAATDSFGLGVAGTTRYGASIAAGDFNGDGLADAAFAGRSSAWGVDAPVIHVYNGITADPGFSTAPQVTIPLDRPIAADAMLAAADVDGDGLDDLVIGLADGDASGAGLLQVYLGASAGLPVTASAEVLGAGTNENFGGAIAAVGDVNGDGFEDIVVGADAGLGAGGAATGAAHVYAGSAQGLEDTPLVSLLGEEADDRFGLHVSGGGDVNADGYDDLLISAPDAQNGRGRVYLYLGSGRGPLDTPAQSFTGPAEPARLLGAMVGDLDNDRYADAILRVEPSASDPGRLRVLRGSATGLVFEGRLSFPDPTGAIPAPAGDVNGDGYDDVVVGSPGFDSAAGTDVGLTHLFFGGPDGPERIASRGLVGGRSSYAYGYAIGIGDTDGDGYHELAVGGPGSAGAGGIAILGGHAVPIATAQPSASPGEEVEVQVQTGSPAADVMLRASGRSVPIGTCLEEAAELCTGLVRAVDHGTVQADPSGLASFAVPLPSTLRPGITARFVGLVLLDNVHFDAAERSEPALIDIVP